MAKFKIVNFFLGLYVAVVSSSFVPAEHFSLPTSDEYVLESHYYGLNCAPKITCDPTAKYRTMDGSCNNLKLTWLGATGSPHFRIMKTFYDGDYQFRKQSDCKPLPNAREIQIKMFLKRQKMETKNDRNVLFMAWGQFVTHDIAQLNPKTSDGVDCCALQTQNPVPVQCQEAVAVPKNDPFYLNNGQTCINFIRAETSADYGCPMKPTTFLVNTTHYLDGSTIYGADDQTAKSLRSFECGRLRSEFFDNHMEFCPQLKRNSSRCFTSSNSAVCFLSADPRINQNLPIALLQNAFLRFHNYIAGELSILNPNWSEEILFQETRRFVVAVIQQITYTVYLPSLLGEEFANINEQSIYNDELNPSTSQEFTSAAFRVLHNEIPGYLQYGCIDSNDFHTVVLTDFMFKPDPLTVSDNFDQYFYGLLNQKTREEQPSYNPFISNNLFQQTSPYRSQDLLVADINRGRDTGLPSYTKMRVVCGLPEAKSFDDLCDLFTQEEVDKLKELYSRVEDIDLMVGLLLEGKVEGTKVGPTAKCIIINSFYRYKGGDRFFYDLQGQPGSFTNDQLQTIKNFNLATIICATTNLKRLPKNIFMTPDGSTTQYECGRFALDLKAWKEN